MTPDVTVSTAAALESQLAAWAADWNGTVPGGKTVTDERVIGVDTALSAAVDGTSLTFPHKVWIRSVGTYADYDCSIKMTGVWDFTGSTNVGVLLSHFVGGKRVVMDSTTDCAIRECFLQGIDTADPANHAGLDATPYVLQISGNGSGLAIEDNCIGYGEYGIYMPGGSHDGLKIRRNVFDWTASDNIHSTCALTNFEISDNWAARNLNSAGIAAHEDFFQQRVQPLDGGLFRGNVFLLDQTRWHNNSGGVAQVIFVGDNQNCLNTTFEQNIFASDIGVIKLSGGKTGTITQNNTALHIEGSSVQNYDAYLDGATKLRNFTMTDDPDDSGAGTDGIAIDVGDYASKDMSVSDTYFDGATPVESDPIGAYKPATGMATHWNFGGTRVGAYERLQEIFETGGNQVPGNVGWPVAAPWEDAYNTDDAITTTHSGSYDADGKNTGSPPPSLPELHPTITITLTAAA